MKDPLHLRDVAVIQSVEIGLKGSDVFSVDDLVRHAFFQCMRFIMAAHQLMFEPRRH
jgi:hypothetical protein